MVMVNILTVGISLSLMCPDSDPSWAVNRTHFR